jgi:hypothetical protein
VSSVKPTSFSGLLLVRLRFLMICQELLLFSSAVFSANISSSLDDGSYELSGCAEPTVVLYFDREGERVTFSFLKVLLQTKDVLIRLCQPPEAQDVQLCFNQSPSSHIARQSKFNGCPADTSSDNEIQSSEFDFCPG